MTETSSFSSVSFALSIFALIVSLASLGVSAYVALRDRARLKIISVFYETSEWGPSKIHVTVINRGRRIAILRLIGGTSANGNWGGCFVGREGGQRLAEHERYEYDVAKDDLVGFSQGDEDIVYETLWIEDSLGVRHEIPNSRDYVKKLQA